MSIDGLGRDADARRLFPRFILFLSSAMQKRIALQKCRRKCTSVSIRQPTAVYNMARDRNSMVIPHVQVAAWLQASARCLQAAQIDLRGTENLRFSASAQTNRNWKKNLAAIKVDHDAGFVRCSKEAIAFDNPPAIPFPVVGESFDPVAIGSDVVLWLMSALFWKGRSHAPHGAENRNGSQALFAELFAISI